VDLGIWDIDLTYLKCICHMGKIICKNKAFSVSQHYHRYAATHSPSQTVAIAEWTTASHEQILMRYDVKHLGARDSNPLLHMQCATNDIAASVYGAVSTMDTT